MPALADELPPQLFGKVAERDRRRPGRALEPPPLLGEIAGEPRLEITERDLDGASIGPVEPSETGRTSRAR